MLFSPLFLFVEPSAEGSTPVSEQSLFELLASGGPVGLIIVAILLLLSAVAMYIFIERYMSINKAAQVDDNFMNNIRMNVLNGNVQAARSQCQASGTPVSRMIEKGLVRIDKPLRDIEHAIENVGKLEVYKLEKNLGVLSIIAGIAPMLGFLGTIAGMIQTFQALSASNNLSIGVISGGIYVKMFTSGLGLIVGIMAFVGYNLLHSKIDRIVNTMERNTFDFIDLIQEQVN